MNGNLYEAMFLVDSARGGGHLPATIQHIAGLLTRQDAHIERIERWAELKLTYPIKGVERGIYVLVYFRLDPGGVAELRRAVGLSEEIMRVLILKDPVVAEVKGELYDAEGQRIEPQEVAAPVEVAEESEGAGEAAQA